jgi:hypothetical protein
VYGESPRLETRENSAELRHGAAPQGARAVTGWTADDHVNGDGQLLRHLDHVERAAEDVERKPAELADRVADASKELRTLIDEETGAAISARLLVRNQGEDQVAGRGDAVVRGAQEGAHHHRHAALHVECAASPHVAVGYRAGKRRHAPRRIHGGNDIDMAVEEKRRRSAVPGQSRDQIRPAGHLLGSLRDEARFFEQTVDEVDARALMARRVGRVEAKELLKQFDRVFARGQSRQGHKLSLGHVACPVIPIPASFLPFLEQKERGRDEKSKPDQVIPAKRLLQVRNGEPGEDDERDDLLDRL